MEYYQQILFWAFLIFLPNSQIHYLTFFLKVHFEIIITVKIIKNYHSKLFIIMIIIKNYLIFNLISYLYHQDSDLFFIKSINFV